MVPYLFQTFILNGSLCIPNLQTKWFPTYSKPSPYMVPCVFQTFILNGSLPTLNLQPKWFPTYSKPSPYMVPCVFQTFTLNGSLPTLNLQPKWFPTPNLSWLSTYSNGWLPVPLCPATWAPSSGSTSADNKALEVHTLFKWGGGAHLRKHNCPLGTMFLCRTGRGQFQFALLDTFCRLKGGGVRFTTQKNKLFLFKVILYQDRVHLSPSSRDPAWKL